MNLRIFYGFVFLLFYAACKPTDKQKLLGKWQCENDWFHYKTDSTYSSGKYEITMVDNYKYTLDAQTHELNIYTNKANETFYLKYKFVHDDTLYVRNIMSSDTSWVVFTRQNEKKWD
jgi:hypothetical protein